jgi:NAD(P)-dependent dehydrogenase (short-subunit alcohol dehydrogenase family)
MFEHMEKNLSLKNKVAIVTGAGSGIGEAIAHKFAQLGAKVVCVGLPGDPVGEVVKAIKKRGHKGIAFEGDISHPERAQECVDVTVKQYGRIDILVNNAGVYLTSVPTENISDEAFDRTFKSNIASTFFMTRAALVELQKSHGVILANSSVAGLKGEPGNSVYGASKGFINSFMQGLALEQAPHGIRVNCVLPGTVDTAMTRAAKSPMDKQAEKTMTDGVPMKRRGTPEEIANAFAFLASDMASYVSGVLFPVDGAFSIAWGGEVEEVPSQLRKKPKGALDKVLSHSHAGGFKKNNPAPKSALRRH